MSQAKPPQVPQSEAVAQKRFFIPKESLKYDELKDKLASDVGYGVTYKGTYQSKPVAIKVIKVSLDFKTLSHSQSALMNQIEHSMALNHENFLPYLGWSHDEEKLYIASTYCDRGGLKDLLKREVISSDVKVRIAEDVARGLQHLHDNDVIHRDMKTSNVMISDNYRAQVYDVGIAKLAREKQKQEAVPRPSIDAILRPSIELLNRVTGNALSSLTGAHPTEGRKSIDLLTASSASAGSIETVMYPWMPPELTQTNKYGQASDVYGYGCMLFEMITLKTPYQYEIEEQQTILAGDIWKLKEQGKKPIVPGEEELSKDPKIAALISIMKQCLESEPNKRPTCFEVIALLLAITHHVFHVSKEVASNHYPSLTEVLKVRECLSDSAKAAICVHAGDYHENEDLYLNRENTKIIGQRGSVLHGHFLTISKNNIEVDSITFESEEEDFHLNIAFCSPTIKRCSIRGNIMMFGDESTHPIICYNVITNPTFISNIMSIGEFKYNQFKPASALGKNSKKKKASSFDSHSAMGLAHALENKDVTVMNLSDHGINDAIAKYIAISLVKCNKIIKLDLSLNCITDVGATSIADAIEKNATIEYVDLSGNEIGKKGAKSLARALGKQTSMKRMNLSNNRIGLKGAKYFADVLKHNTNLLQLDLSYNQIGDLGCKMLLEAVMENKSLLQLCIAHNELSPEMEAQIDVFKIKFPHIQILL